MTKKTFTCELFPPHLKTAEGSKRFEAAVEQRANADYACFMVLRDMNDEGLLTKKAIRDAVPKHEFGSVGELEEFVDHHVEQVREALKKRRDADIEFSNALLNRP